MTDTIVQISSQLTAPKKKNNKKKPINEWRTIPVSGALGLSLQFFGEKKNKAKPKKKKKKKNLVYPLRAMLCVHNLNTKVRIKSFGIKIARSPCFEV